MSTRAIIAMPRSKGELPAPDAQPTGFFGKLLRIRPKPQISGVYHHSEGYPSALGELLFDLVNHRYRRDVGKLWHEIIEGNPAGWSNLFPLGVEPLRSTWNGTAKVTAAEHFARVADDGPELPVTYQGDPQRDLGFNVPPIAEYTDKMGAVFVYAITPSSLVIFSVDADGIGITERRRVAWGDTPDWDAIQEEIYALLDG